MTYCRGFGTAFLSGPFFARICFCFSKPETCVLIFLYSPPSAPATIGASLKIGAIDGDILRGLGSLRTLVTLCASPWACRLFIGRPLIHTLKISRPPPVSPQLDFRHVPKSRAWLCESERGIPTVVPPEMILHKYWNRPSSVRFI